jgi:hypothetical protein
MQSNNLPPIYRFDWGDYLQLGATFQKFLANLNLFTLGVYNLLNGGIGFANLQRSIYKATVTAGNVTPLSFVNPLSIAPSGLSLVQCLAVGATAQALSSSVSVGNWTYDGKTISVLNISGLVSGVTYQIALEVL